jgi:hypothetical protein
MTLGLRLDDDRKIFGCVGGTFYQSHCHQVLSWPGGRYEARINEVVQAYCILLIYLHEASESQTYHWQHESKLKELDLDDQLIEAARRSADLIPTPTSLRILVSKVMSEDQKALVVRAKRLL